MTKMIKTFITLLIIMFVINILFRVRIKKVEIIGNEKVSDTEIVASIFRSDFDRSSIVLYLKSKYLKHPEIKMVNKYEIEWITPYSIIINVDEDKAVAFMKRDLKNVYFDKNGVINEVTEYRKPGAVEVVGVSFKNYEKGDTIEISNKRVLNSILSIACALSEYKLNAELLEIKKDEKVLIYIGNVIVDMGDLDNMNVKLKRLNEIYPEIAHLSGTLDLSEAREYMYDEQYIFKKTN